MRAKSSCGSQSEAVAAASRSRLRTARQLLMDDFSTVCTDTDLTRHTPCLTNVNVEDGNPKEMLSGLTLT